MKYKLTKAECSLCKGFGCPFCDGGYHYEYDPIITKEPYCPSCGGSGMDQITGGHCLACNGQG